MHLHQLFKLTFPLRIRSQLKKQLYGPKQIDLSKPGLRDAITLDEFAAELSIFTVD